MNQKAVDKAVAFLESWLAYRVRRIDIPGFSVAVLVNDQIVLSKAYGLADLERAIPLTTKHLFSVASQTKMATAVAVWQLIEKGKLGLDDRACHYVPWLCEHPNRYAREVTIRHLLNHTAGLTHSGHDNDYWVFKAPSLGQAELRDAVIGATFVARPGTSVKYANIGFGLLGQVIEAVSEQRFGGYLSQNVLPLVRPTVVDYSTDLGDRVPVGYSLPLDGHRRPISPRRPMHALAPAAGLHASAETMCRWVSTLFYGNKKLVSDATKKRLFAPQAKVTAGLDKGMEFGFGFMRQTAGTHHLMGHDAHLAGHLSATFFDPAQKIAVAVCTNAAQGLPVTNLIHGIFGALDYFSEHPAAQNSPFSVRLVNKISSLQIVDSGGRIVAIDPDDWEPFAWYELLEKVDSKTLRVITQGNVFNKGELAHYTFNKGRVRQVRFGGMTFWPDRQR